MGAFISFPNGCSLSEAGDTRYFRIQYDQESWGYPKGADGLKRALEDVLITIEGKEYHDPDSQD